MKHAKTYLMVAASFFFAAIMLLASFYMPATHENSISPEFSAVAVTYNSTDNQSLSAIGSLLSYLQPDVNYTTINLNSASYSNTSYGHEITSNGNIVLNNTSYSYTFNFKFFNGTSSSAEINTLLMSRKTTKTVDLSGGTTDTYTNVTDYNVSTNTNVYVAQTVQSTNLTIHIAESVSDQLAVTHPPLLPRVYTTDSGYDNHYYMNKTYGYGNNTTSIVSHFLAPAGSGTGIINISSDSYVVNNTANQTITDQNITNGYLNLNLVNGSTVDNYIVSIAGDNATLSKGTDPVNFTIQDPLKTGVINNAIFLVYEAQLKIPKDNQPKWELAVEVGAGLVALAMLGYGVTLIGQGSTTGVSFALSRGLTTAADILADGTIMGSVGGAIAIAAGIVFSISTEEVTNEVLDHSGNGYFGIYFEIGFDVRNIPLWEFWSWPPIICAYGEVGAFIGISGEGVNAEMFYPAITSYFNHPNHQGLIPGNLPPWT